MRSAVGFFVVLGLAICGLVSIYSNITSTIRKLRYTVDLQNEEIQWYKEAVKKGHVHPWPGPSR